MRLEIFKREGTGGRRHIISFNVVLQKDGDPVQGHLVYLGKLENFEDKLARLKEFYKKGLNRVGWNKYSRINLEFNNQIICTKRE